MFAILPSLARQLRLTEFEASLPFVLLPQRSGCSPVGVLGREQRSLGPQAGHPSGAGRVRGFVRAFATCSPASSLAARAGMVAYPLMIAARSHLRHLRFGRRARGASLCRGPHDARANARAAWRHHRHGIRPRHDHRSGHRLGARRIRAVRAVLFHRRRGVRERGRDLVLPARTLARRRSRERR